jgi:hypothetical protein
MNSKSGTQLAQLGAALITNSGFFMLTVSHRSLLQAQVHLAVLIEVDPQHVFLPAGKLARHRGGLVMGGSIRGHLHPETMFPR